MVNLRVYAIAAEFFTDRTDVQCLHRWQKVLNPDLVKGAWTKEEDDRIMELVSKYGAKKWSVIAQNLPGRIGKQCRERCASEDSGCFNISYIEMLIENL